MDKEEVKKRIDLTNIQEKTIDGMFDSVKMDYLVDYEGNFILPVSQLEAKLIEKILDLEARIKILEKK